MRDLLIYRHVFIVKTVLGVFRSESRRVGWSETGGPLVGYLSADEAVVVTGAAGPGPRARLGLTNVQIDGEHATAFCDRIYHESKGSLDYIGDWHRHTLWSLKPSKSDEEAMWRVAVSGSCSLTAPISIIYRRYPESFCVYVLDAENHLSPVAHSLINSIPE